MKAHHTQTYEKSESHAKFIALGDFIKKLERSYSHNLTAHLKALEQIQANLCQRSRQQNIFKLEAETNQLETKRTKQIINEIKSWFFEKINKIDKPLAKLTTRQREKS